MGNLNSNQLIKNQDLAAPLIEKETKLEEESQNIADSQQYKINSQQKKIRKKGKKNKLDIILNQKDLLPEQFSSLEEQQKAYLDEKEKKKRSFLESCEWESKVFEIEEITCLTVTNDDKFLISATQTGLTTLFDLETRRPIHYFVEDYERKINSITVSQDNEYVITAEKHNIGLFNLNTKEKTYIKYWGTVNFLAVLLSKDKKHAIAGGKDGSVNIFDIPARKKIHSMISVHQGNEIK